MTMWQPPKSNWKPRNAIWYQRRENLHAYVTRFGAHKNNSDEPDSRYKYEVFTDYGKRIHSGVSNSLPGGKEAVFDYFGINRCEHLDYTDSVCPDCGLEVNMYGNTEERPNDYCSYPDCGCDGARLCDAKDGPSERAAKGNVEGMWSGKTLEQRKAVVDLMTEVADERKKK